MNCYKGKTYCQFYLLCKNKNCTTPPLTEEVKEAAIRASMNICVYNDFPDCFIRFFDDSLLGDKE